MRLILEYKNFTEVCPQNVYVIPSLDSMYEWYGCIFLQYGFWNGGIYKFQISIPSAYPHKIPQVIFLTKLYHPLVKPDGKISMLNFSFLLLNFPRIL